MLLGEKHCLPGLIDPSQPAVGERTRRRRTVIGELNTLETIGGQLLKQLFLCHAGPDRIAAQIDKIIQVEEDPQLRGINRSVVEVTWAFQNSSQAIWDALTPSSVSIFRHALTIIGGPQR